jgi:hypothetical protein
MLRGSDLSPCVGFRFAYLLKSMHRRGDRVLDRKWRRMRRSNYALAVPPLVVICFDISLGTEDRTAEYTCSIGSFFAAFGQQVAFTRSDYVEAQVAICEAADWRILPTSPFYVLSDAVESDADYRSASAMLETVIAFDVVGDAVATALAALAALSPRGVRSHAVAAACDRLTKNDYFAYTARGGAEERAHALSETYDGIVIDSPGWSRRRRSAPNHPLSAWMERPCNATCDRPLVLPTTWKYTTPTPRPRIPVKRHRSDSDT